MRIAYITTYDPNDRRQWSGSGHAILQSLRLQGFDVVPLGPMRNRLAWLGRQKGRFYYRLLGQSYEFDREALAAWDYALQIKGRLAREPSGRYRQLAYAARREYDERLNWQVAGATVRRYVEALVPPGTASV